VSDVAWLVRGRSSKRPPQPKKHDEHHDASIEAPQGQDPDELISERALTGCGDGRLRAEPAVPASRANHIDPALATAPDGDVDQRALDEPAIRGAVDVALLALIASACVVNVLAPSGTVRTTVTLIAALLVPGAAVMTRLPLGDLAYTAALVVGTSLAIDVAASLTMVWTQWWHPVLAASVLAGLAAAALAADYYECTFRSTRRSTS
jgi:hypothetical protein